jgi:hypothetical protein
MPDAAAADTATPDADWARPLYERQIAMLGDMAEAGLRIALEVERQVKAADVPPDPAAVQTAVLTFARVSRAVRLSLMLQARLIKDLEARDRHGAYLASCAVDRKKARVAAIVERIAQGQDLDEDHIDRRVEEAAERLD